MNLHLPPVYLSHGSPMTALEPGAAGRYFGDLGRTLVQAFGRPRTIVAVSAHTLTREPVLLAAPRHDAIHDFSGFDAALYELRYDAAGAPELAARTAELLRGASLPAHVLAEGGLDHGIWTPLRYAFPAADVPIVPLGWPPDWAPARLFALGRALAPLAADGVWLMASGSITHNLRRLFAGGLGARVDAPQTPESRAFRDWWAERAAVADWDALFDYRRQAPHAALMHPTDEHLLPFFVAAGAAGEGATGLRVHASQSYGELGMDAYAFGPDAAKLADPPGGSERFDR